MNIEVVSMRNKLSIELGTTAIKIDRTSVLGNPFAMEKEEERDACNQAYREWLWQIMKTADDEKVNPVPLLEKYNLSIAEKWKNPTAGEVRKELNRILDTGNVRLLCWCAPLPCHGDVVKKCLEWMAHQRKLLDLF